LRTMPATSGLFELHDSKAPEGEGSNRL
jgi:hypothetical protein